MAQLTRSQKRARSRKSWTVKGPVHYSGPVGIGRVFGASARAIVDAWEKTRVQR